MFWSFTEVTLTFGVKERMRFLPGFVIDYTRQAVGSEMSSGRRLNEGRRMWFSRGPVRTENQGTEFSIECEYFRL